MKAEDKAMAREYDPTRAQTGEGTVFRAEKSVAQGAVICEIGKMVIPTYIPPEPEEMPVYSEYRQHQGSTGNAYPNRPTLNATRDVLTDRDYIVIRLENQYIRLLILPEIGGRVLEAYDKTTDYNFLYRHHRIKPVIVGSYGSWISGGMEFNYPFHHRPSTFLPVDFTTETRADGSVIVWLSEAAPSPGQYRLKGTYGICLTPDASYYETIVKLDNRTPVKHPFMWWENAAIHVNKDYQLFFPQDVGYVHHHYDRHHATFPISKGWYAVENHEEETDISQHLNTIKGNSYFAAPSRYDFFGGYDHGRDCGTVHVADHHITPGKKMFQWALEDLGDAWNNNLTDNDGEHAELMAGSYDDDQPDFTYIAPYEVKRFSQFWYPIHGTGLPIFANLNGCISLDREEGKISAAVTKAVEEAVLEVSLKEEGKKEKVLLNEKVTLSPSQSAVFDLKTREGERYTFRLTTKDGKVLIDYTEDIPEVLRIPEDNPGIPTPEELTTAEELTNTGLHIDQYRDPSWHGREYFLRALEREPSYAPALLAMAEDALNRYSYEEGLGYIDRAERTLFKHSHNPYDGTIFYLKGLLQYGAGDVDEAYETLYKAAWSGNVISPAMTWIAAIDGQRGDYEEMRNHAALAIEKEGQHAIARAYLAVAEYHLGNKEGAVRILEEILGIGAYIGAIAASAANARGVGRSDGDKLDHLARFLYYTYTGKDMEGFYALLKSNPSQTCIDIALDLAHAGQKEEAAAVLSGLKDSKTAVGSVPVGVYAEDAVPVETEGAEGRHGLFDRYQVQAGTPEGTALCAGSYGKTKGSMGLGNLSVMGHYMLAAILDELGKETEADKIRKMVQEHYIVDIFPYRPEELKVLKKAAEDKNDACAVYLEGCLLYDKMHSEEAFECFRRAVSRDEKLWQAYRCMGAALYSRLERREEALPYYKKAVELCPGNELLLIETNFIMARVGIDPQERLDWLMANKPEKINDQLTWELAEVMNEAGKFDDAISTMLGHEFVAAECQETYLTESWTFANVAKGRIFMKEGKAKEALKYFRDAQTIQPNFRAGWWDTQALYYPRVYEALCLLSLGDEEGAKKKAAEVLPFIHSNYSPYMGPESDVYVGYAMRILGDKVNSVKYVSDAVIRWENDLKGAFGGNGRKSAGDGRRDRKPIVTALFLTTVPDGAKEHDSEVYQALGYSRLFFGDENGAKDCFAKSLALDPSNHKARFELSMLK